MDEPPQTAVAPPSSDERTMATLAHVLQLVGGWIAPLLIFILKRDSRFVAFHALQVLLLQGVYMLVWIMAIMVGFFVMFSAVLMHPNASSGPPAPIFLLFPFFWLGFMGMWVVMLVTAIVYGVKAGNGEWAEYPVLGAMARHFLKIGPGGATL